MKVGYPKKKRNIPVFSDVRRVDAQWANTLIATQHSNLERLWSNYSYMKIASYVSINMTQFDFRPRMVGFCLNPSLKIALRKFEFAANLNWLGYSGALW